MLNTEEGRQLLALFGSLTAVGSWRLSGRPFPMVVLDATEPQANVGAYVDALAQPAAEAHIPHMIPILDTAAEDAELTLLDTMSESNAWRSPRPEIGPLRFPRSDLVRSLERAIERAEQNNTSPADEWNAASSSPRRSNRAPVWWSTIGVIAAALLGGFAQGLADRVTTAVLLGGAGMLLAVILLAAGLLTRRFWLPILTRLGFGTRYHWFATSSFFTVLHPFAPCGAARPCPVPMTGRRWVLRF